MTRSASDLSTSQINNAWGDFPTVFPLYITFWDRLKAYAVSWLSWILHATLEDSKPAARTAGSRRRPGIGMCHSHWRFCSCGQRVQIHQVRSGLLLSRCHPWSDLLPMAVSNRELVDRPLVSCNVVSCLIVVPWKINILHKWRPETICFPNVDCNLCTIRHCVLKLPLFGNSRGWYLTLYHNCGSVERIFGKAKASFWTCIKHNHPSIRKQMTRR